MNSQFSVDELQDKYLFSEQVKLLYAGKPLVLIISSIVAIAFAYIQWSVLDQTSLIIWLSLMFSVIVSRTVLYFMYRRTVPDIDHTNMWYRLFVTGTATAGLLWASLVYWGIPEHDLIYQNFTIILLIGMTAGAITTQSFRKIPFLVFILPILLSLMWYFLNSQLAVGTALGVATILYFVGLSAAALNMNRATIQVICSKYEMGKKDIALEESERRYQNILETAVDAFFLHDLHGRFLDTNQQACRNLGYTRDELLQRYVFDIEMKASTDRDLGSMWDEMSEGESATLIGEHKRKDGSTFPVEVRVRALKSQGMKLFSVLARDITERKLAEEALRLSEEQATAQYKGMPLPTYTWHFRDNEFYLEDYNDAAEKFTRGVVKEYLGIQLSVMYADEPDIINDIHKTFHERTTIEKEITLFFKHARVTRNLAMKYAYIPPDMVIIHTEDITDRIQSEQALKKSEASLEQAQHIAKLGNWSWDLTNGYIEWSDEIYNIFEYDKATTPANQENFIKAMHPDDIKLMQASEQRAMQGERYFDEEWRIITSTGKQKYIQLLGERYFNTDGLPVKMVGTMQDITERKQAEIMKNEFVSTVSHEIRTPLTSIMGALGLMQSGVAGEFDGESAQLIKIAYENSQRLLLLINDILDISTIESGKLSLDIKPYLISKMVEDAIEASDAFFKQHSVTVNLHDETNKGIELCTDASRFMQVMNNLLSNAAKFSDAANSVDVYVEASNALVRISVKDYGTGISAEFKPYIFEKFTRSDSSNTRSTGGTGLGLNITRRIVEVLGGRINFESDITGTTFYFELPISNKAH